MKKMVFLPEKAAGLALDLTRLPKTVDDPRFTNIDNEDAIFLLK
jgi:hypothetical protein